MYYNVRAPENEGELNQYFHFRWQILRAPFKLPQGSEKDEYESVSEHRLVCDANGAVLAVGRVHLNAPEEAQIRHVAVAAEYRMQGVGRFIIGALEEVARKLGAERVVTNSMESSVAFFKHCGYQVQESAPKELDMQKRQQMLKKLQVHSAWRLHPQWCEELQTTWHDTIPISEHMGIKLHRFTGHALEVRASLNKNINLHGSMFAGSIFSLATLTGWGMLFLLMKQRGLSGEIVLGDGDIHYHKPVTSEPRAICSMDTITGELAPLQAQQKCRVDVQVNIQDADRPVAKFKGVYWVLPSSSASKPAGS